MERKVKRRALFALLGFALFFLGLVVRMYWVQVVDSPWLMKQAQAEWQSPEALRAVRGEITDRNGKVLAEDSTAYTVAVNPRVIGPKKIEGEVAKGLAGILSPSSEAGEIAKLEDKIYKLATKKNESGNLLAEVEVRSEGWKIDGETKQKIDQFMDNLKVEHGWSKDADVGIYLKETFKRVYPYNNLASHVLGYVNKEGKPVGGIEGSLNDFLAGTSGLINRQTDLKGVEVPDSKVTYTPAINGKNVRLTIDQTIQYYMETAMRKTFDKWKPKSLMAVALDPKTMEIVAMSNMPDYDPNKYWDVSDPGSYANRAVSNRFEPGSTFKLVTLAGAIEEGIFHPGDIYQSGSIQVFDRRLKDHQTGWGPITYMDALIRSSNVGFVKLGYEGLGVQRLTDYITRFGFGQKTGVDLPGESAGLFRPTSPVDYATATYGQGAIGVTALQLATAYGAIANGGNLMRPHVVKSISDADTGAVVQKYDAQIVRRVVSEATAKQTTLDLEQVIEAEHGTGKGAHINGYRVAGKTGTAQIVIPGERGYADRQYLISFVGYAPAEDPKLLVAVVAETPDLGGDYHKGGLVTLPLFKEIMQQSLNHLGVSAAVSSEAARESEPMTKVPDVKDMGPTAAQKELSARGLKADIIGKGKAIVAQYPAPGTEITLAERIYLITEKGVELQVPDMKGRSLAEALEMCSVLNVKCSPAGEGYVSGQEVAGTGAERIVTLTLAPLGRPADPGGASGATGPSVPDAAGTAKPGKSAATPAGRASPSPTPSPSLNGSAAAGRQ